MTTLRITKRPTLAVLLLLALAASAVAAPVPPRDAKGLPLWEIATWNDAPVRIELPDHAALDELLATVPIASFNREQIRIVYTDPKHFHLVFEPRVTDAEAARLAAAGYAVTVLPDHDRAGREATEARWLAQYAAGGKAAKVGEKGTYPTHAQIGARFAELATLYPNLCRDFTWGQSVQGRDLWGITISADVQNSAAEPEVRLSGTMHGDEVVPMYLLFTLAQELVENYGQPGHEDITALLDHTEITILPSYNPDGTAANTRYNANGVDLNRNFELPAGTHPSREIETQQFMTFSQNHHFVISQNGHGGALVVNYPWDYTYDLAPDNDALIQLSLEYSTQNLPMYNGSFPQGITNGADWYVTTGCLQDWSYDQTDCVDVTIEVSNTKWPAESTLDGYWADNRQSLLDFIDASHYGVNGVVTGSDTGLPLDATITVVGNAMPVHTDPDHGDYYKLLDTGTYDITYSAYGYITQTVTGVATTWGTPTVLDVVLQPVAHGDVTGVVTDLGGTGLAAQVHVYTEPLNTWVTAVNTDAAGAYSVNLVYGDYRLEAVSTGYVGASAQVTVGAVPVVQDFQLGQAEEVVLFSDDFESGTGNWAGSWGPSVPATGHASANSINDSPGANYADNANTTWAMAAGADLSGAFEGTFSFWARWEIEAVWDGAYCEVSDDGGASWTPLATAYTHASSGQGGQSPSGKPVFDGTRASWVLNSIDLAPWLGETDVRFRFRLASDTSINYSGFFVDDVELKVIRQQVASGGPDLPAPVVAVSAWPNPFNPRATLRYAVPRAGAVELAVYDLQGRRVRTLVAANRAAGEHSTTWDGTDAAGRRVPSGVYFARLRADGGHEAVTRLSLIK
ncbi:immune inhibitor A [bacterium]|nr:immune inhibitor A [bacterium]